MRLRFWLAIATMTAGRVRTGVAQGVTAIRAGRLVDERKYHSMSPINHVARVRTPTLFFHGGRDQRCPVGESERMHVALRLEGLESKLAIFPEESHEFDNAASAYPERLRTGSMSTGAERQGAT